MSEASGIARPDGRPRPEGEEALASGPLFSVTFVCMGNSAQKQ